MLDSVIMPYVFFVYTEDTTEYVGNFTDCDSVDAYVVNCYTLPSKHWSTACIHQDYLYLPDGFVPVYRDPEECYRD